MIKWIYIQKIVNTLVTKNYSITLLAMNLLATRGETRALIKGMKIHIFLFCRRISFARLIWKEIRRAEHEYMDIHHHPPPLPTNALVLPLLATRFYNDLTQTQELVYYAQLETSQILFDVSCNYENSHTNYRIFQFSYILTNFPFLFMKSLDAESNPHHKPVSSFNFFFSYTLGYFIFHTPSPHSYSMWLVNYILPTTFSETQLISHVVN